MASSTQLAIAGRIVTMNAADAVLADGVVYVADGKIAAVLPADEPPPAAFTSTPVLSSRGTIYPGLIELHNHLSYNALKLWQVPKRYTNRDQWTSHPDYRPLVSGPMSVLGETEGYPAAVARYAECKCLLAGVTTSQGVALNSNAGMSGYYKGLLRNPERSDGPGFPAARAKIAEVAAEDAEAFLAQLKRASCQLLHLSEGTDVRARNHFKALKLPDGRVAITDALAGIHCVALKAEDFALLAGHGGAMVWSPLSNHLLYGSTADIRAAKSAGIRVGLGSDWSPSGSKNLLGELKVARAVSQLEGGVFSDKDLVAMATRNAAAILKWETAVGSIEVGKHADLLVVDGADKDPYAQLIESRETDVVLVVIDGRSRAGLPRLMSGASSKLETWRVGGRTRHLDLSEPTGVLESLSLREATDRLRHGLRNLKSLAESLEHPGPHAARARLQWTLALDEEEPPGVSIRPRFDQEADAPLKASRIMAAGPLPKLSTILKPLTLDPLTVADDPAFPAALQSQGNLSPALKSALAQSFG